MQPILNDGITLLFKALEANKILNYINVSDTQFGDNKDKMDQIISVMTKNTKIYLYDFKLNGIYNEDKYFYLYMRYV